MDFSKEKVFYAESEEQTEAIGEQLAREFKPGELIALFGGMGMGKTAITRGIARGVGYSDRVTSPTYAIVNEYLGEIPLFHFDLFRLGDADELFDIGFDEYFTRGGIIVVEWFERAEGVYQPDFEIHIEKESENARKITVKRAEK